MTSLSKHTGGRRRKNWTEMGGSLPNHRHKWAMGVQIVRNRQARDTQQLERPTSKTISFLTLSSSIFIFPLLNSSIFDIDKSTNKKQ